MKKVLKRINKTKLIILATIIIVFILSLIKSIYIFNFKYRSSNKYEKYYVMVIEKRKEEENKTSYLVKYLSNKFILNVYNENIKKSDTYSYGDKIELIGKISIPENLNNPYEFDYKRYLNSNNIVTIINAYNIQNVVHTKGNIFYYYILKLKNKVYEISKKNMNEKEFSLFKALIYSDKSSLDEEDIALFTSNGLNYMMAVSGMHITYLMVIVNILTKDMKKLKKIIITTFILFSYIVMASFSVSAIRASIMSISFICFKDKKGYNKYIGIILSLIIMLCINPYVIFNTSFIMSYFATFGIIALNSLANSYFIVHLNLPKILKGIIEPICISICTLIFLLPFQILFFGNINFKSFISNLFISNIISFFYFVSFLLNFLVFIPFVNQIIANALAVILKTIICVLKLLEIIPFPIVCIPRFSAFEIFIYYIAIFLIMNRKYIYKYFSKKYWKKLKLLVNILLIVIFFIIFSFTLYRIYFENYIWYFNVEQGNMCIIRQNRKVVIYDFGSTTKNLSYNVLNNFLKAKAIKKIDLVVLTHMHEDHVNAIYDMCKNYDIQKIIYPVTYSTSEEYTKISMLLEVNNIKSECVFENTKLNIGKNIEISFLTPNKDAKILDEDILNANSLTSIVTIEKNENYMFMGDATFKTEKYILDKKLDEEMLQKLNNIKVIQIGHHGSKTSTSEEFLKLINPCIALISSKKKVYGHPSKETLEKLENLNFTTIITEQKGAFRAK